MTLRTEVGTDPVTGMTISVRALELAGEDRWQGYPTDIADWWVVEAEHDLTAPSHLRFVEVSKGPSEQTALDIARAVVAARC